MLRPIVILLAVAAIVALPATTVSAPALPKFARYGLVLLRHGVRPDVTPAQAESLQAGHMANIRRMFASGALDAAGPFGDDTPLAGIFVFEPDSMPALERLLAPDPLLHSGRLVAESYAWQADAGVGREYRERSRAGAVKDSMVSFTMVLLRRVPAVSPVESPTARFARSNELAQQRAWGWLVLGGPIQGDSVLSDVHLYATDSAAVRSLVARDPAVRAGRLVPEYHPWWTVYGNVPGH